MQRDPALDDEDAAKISARLSAVIRDEIDRDGGWLRFARFMDLALYAPGLGYYSAGSRKIGPGGGDFVTSPELTPLFARALARPVAAVLATAGETILELGGGTGRLAADLLRELDVLGRLPRRYLLLEVSADFAARQRATLRHAVPHLADRIEWPTSLPDRIDGVVLGNEVLDALPVDLVVRGHDGWLARGVTAGEQGFRFADRPLPDDLAEVAAAAGLDVTLFPNGYVTELHAAANGLVASLLSRMSGESVAILIDYGFPRSEYYHPQRSTGTMMAHRRHRASLDLLAAVGLQDLTAHVDFSGVADAAVAGGGLAIGYTSQATFLLDCGIADLLEGPASDVRRWAPQAHALNLLLSPAEMGELFKVIALGKRVRSLAGFGSGDRIASL